MKFDMGSQTLGSLTNNTQTSSDDLGSLITRLVDAATPLEGNFNGAGKQAFDNLKNNTDEITRNLNSALAAIIGGQQGMDQSFQAGESEMQDTASTAEGAAPFDTAQFSNNR